MDIQEEIKKQIESNPEYIIRVDTCPAQAANGKLWNTSTDRDEFYDAHRCRTKCRELSKLHINKEISLCGICVAVCPIGKKKLI